VTAHRPGCALLDCPGCLVPSPTPPSGAPPGVDVPAAAVSDTAPSRPLPDLSAWAEAMEILSRGAGDPRDPPLPCYVWRESPDPGGWVLCHGTARRGSAVLTASWFDRAGEATRAAILAGLNRSTAAEDRGPRGELPSDPVDHWDAPAIGRLVADRQRFRGDAEHWKAKALALEVERDALQAIVGEWGEPCLEEWRILNQHIDDLAAGPGGVLGRELEAARVARNAAEARHDEAEAGRLAAVAERDEFERAHTGLNRHLDRAIATVTRVAAEHGIEERADAAEMLRDIGRALGERTAERDTARADSRRAVDDIRAAVNAEAARARFAARENPLDAVVALVDHVLALEAERARLGVRT
jgi:hypothetical protein